MVVIGVHSWPRLTDVAINRAGEAQEVYMTHRRFPANGRENTSSQRLQKANQQLYPLLDQINEGFSQAEKRLKVLNPVKDEWVTYRSELDDPMNPDQCYCLNYCIGIAKVKGEWRLCCGTTHDGCPELEVQSVEPVSDMSRWVRVEVAAQLPQWFPELQERVTRTTEEFVENAQKALEKMLAGLNR